MPGFQNQCLTLSELHYIFSPNGSNLSTSFSETHDGQLFYDWWSFISISPFFVSLLYVFVLSLLSFFQSMSCYFIKLTERKNISNDYDSCILFSFSFYIKNVPSPNVDSYDPFYVISLYLNDTINSYFHFCFWWNGFLFPITQLEVRCRKWWV